MPGGLHSGWHLEPESNVEALRRFAGGFVPNDVSHPATLFGIGFSVIRSAVGSWLLTIDGGWVEFFGGSVTLQHGSIGAADYALSVGNVLRASRVVQIVSRVAGVRTDIAAAAQGRVVWFELRYSCAQLPAMDGLGS